MSTLLLQRRFGSLLVSAGGEEQDGRGPIGKVYV